MDVQTPICFHCGEPTKTSRPVSIMLQGVERFFCCAGCAAAAEWITGAGLSDYYRWRERAPAIADADAQIYGEDWDNVQFLDRHATLIDGTRQIVLLVDGMHCAACAWLINRALARETGVVSAHVGFATRRLNLRWDPATTRLSNLFGILSRLGYRAHPAGSAQAERARVQATRTDIMRVGLAGLCAMQAMMFTEALYFGAGMDAPVRDVFRWLAFAVSAPAIAWSAWPIYRGALREWQGRRLGMDTPIALSILLAFAASVASTVLHGAEVWYDAAVMFVLLVLASRLLESSLRRRSLDAVEVLARAQPEYAQRIGADGVVESIAVSALAPGDHARVRPGEVVPADGAVAQGTAQVDESLLNGEPRPALKCEGDSVYAGSLCLASPFVFRVDRCGQSTFIADLRRMVERAASERPAVERMSERAAAIFVSVVLLAAAATAVFWAMQDPARAVSATLAVLVVSCPCALALAVPAAVAAAHSRLAQMGVMVLHPDALERLARVDYVLLDKTGTLTCGKPRLCSTHASDDVDAAHARAIGAALERGSRHPLAGAFAPYDDGRAATQVRECAGAGVEGDVDGSHYRLGTRSYAGASLDGDDDGSVCLGSAAGLVARFEIEDTARADAAAACAALVAQGLKIEVLSGDASRNVAPLCAMLGIDSFRAAQSPRDKLDRVRQLQAQGARVAMVGDGINDAPVLAGADLAIALGSGAAMAHRAADIVILGDRLSRLPQTIATARRTRTVMRQNLVWALLYNLAAIPFAATGWMPPWLAALGMTVSSLLVTLNATRLALSNRSFVPTGTPESPTPLVRLEASVP